MFSGVMLVVMLLTLAVGGFLSVKRDIVQTGSYSNHSVWTLYPVRAVLTVLMIGVLCGGYMYGEPLYRVWEREQDGKAMLAKAQYERQTRVAEAEAEKEAAVKLAEAEIIRSEGLAKANKILGDSLKDDKYLYYLYINGIKETQNQVIYIPTEGGLPILEAGKRPTRE